LTFCGWFGCDFEGRGGKERAWFPHPAPKLKKLFYTRPGCGRATQPTPSEAFPRWGNASVPEKHRQDRHKSDKIVLEREKPADSLDAK